MEEFKPDAVLLDIGMPGMDGYDFNHHLVKPADIEQLRQLLSVA